ncbi:MAG: hypothetical protein M3335_03930 [Actinomycetota bacterium]|nr:hypothetical protein [Actinomycetota bacterium]
MESRRLKPEETAVIRVLLDHADFAGRDELLEQVPGARVVGRCGCGCATVELAVDRAPAEDAPPYPIPNQATVLDEDGNPIGGVLLFVKDGCLAELEVYSFEDEPIRVFPGTDRLRLEVEP